MSREFFRVFLSTRQQTLEFPIGAQTISPFRIGNKPGCDYMLHLDTANQFEFALYRSGDEWMFARGDGIRCFQQDGKEVDRCPVVNNLRLALCVDNAGTLVELMRLRTELHFDFPRQRFDRRISLDDVRSLRIGSGSSCMLRINTSGMVQEEVSLSRQQRGWAVEKIRGQYNIYLNVGAVERQAELKDGDFLTIGDVRFYYANNNLYMDSAIQVTLNGLNSIVEKQSTSAMEYPVFIRSTRVQHQIKTDEIEVLQPKSKAQPERENFLLKLLPPLTMIVAMVLLRGLMGSSGMMFVLYSVVSMGISLVVMVLSRKDNKKRLVEDERQRKERYYEYVKKKIEDIKLRRQDELRILDRIYRSTEDNIAIVRNFEKGLFDRSPEDADFLDVRLGRGTREASIQVKTNVPEYRETDDELQDMAMDVVERYRMLEDAPVVARLSGSNAIGVVGIRRWLYEMLKTMTVDLTVRHYYNEMRIYYIIDEDDQTKFAWARWLRNCFDSSLGSYRSIICDPESAKYHLESLYRLLSERETLAKDKETLWSQYYVIFVYRVDIIRNHPISQYFERCNALGVRFVFMDEYEERIPRGCSQLIRLDRMISSGSLIYTNNSEKLYNFEYTQIMEERMREIVMKLCKVHVVEANLANEMVKSISLFDLLGIKKTQELELMSIWSKSRVYKSMSVPLGVRSKNAVVNLDLHEKAHGPHGLVAGTTGSGKSEILQSYIINMAIFFHPYEVTFLLIDFKGGGMANQFIGLPHLAGAITDIDGREIERSLKSIKAELERRKNLFAQVNVNKVDDYIQMYKKDPKSVPAPLPHLIIVVDEFAELKAEHPDFMKELVSAARIGRSLGVHLILATQKPSGVVDAQIWSNSRFKLCLKVQTKEDSMEMLKTPLAAEIREPGRAYLQVGNNEIFELFQSAYSGATPPNVDPSAVTPFKINELNMWGKPTLVYEETGPLSEDGEEKLQETQLDVLVRYIHDYCKAARLNPLPSICLPALPEQLDSSELAGAKKDIEEGILVSVARYDDPEMQYQGDYVLNLSAANIFMIGSPQMGKTTALLSIIFNAIQNYTPHEVNFYIIDCGNMAMKVFEDDRHIGGVVVLSEEDRIQNLFRLLTNIIQSRKALFMDSGVGTYHAYLETGKRDLPAIVLVIDNVPAFREYYEQYDETLQMLAREGISIGLTLIVSGTASNNLSYRMTSNFGTKICFTCNDVSEYVSMVGARHTEPYNYPGRALVMLDKRVVEAQIALPVKGDKESARRAEMLRILSEKVYDDTYRAAKIPIVPDILLMKDVIAERPELFKTPYRVVIGMDYLNVDYVTLPLNEIPSLVINGRPKSGKHNVIKAMMSQLQANIASQMTEAYVLDGPKRSLSELRELSFVSRYTTETESMRSAIIDFWETMSERQESLYELDESERHRVVDSWTLKLLIINSERAISLATGDKECAEKLYDVIARFNDCKVCVIWCEYPNVRVGSIGSTDLARHIQQLGTFLYFDNLANLKMVEVTLNITRMLKRPYILGDAYLFINDQFTHIKTMRCDSAIAN